jgi:ankyrin repeat protein
MGNIRSNLQCAIEKKNNDKIRIILEKIKSIDDYNKTINGSLIHDMIIWGAHISHIEYLILCKQCNINEIYMGSTPIELALHYDRKQIVCALLSYPDLIITHAINKSLIERDFNGVIPAENDYIFSSNVAVVSYAIECSIPIDTFDENGDTPFIHAVKNGNYEVAKFLIKHVSIDDINKAAYYAIEYPPIVELLIESGLVVPEENLETCKNDPIVLKILSLQPQHRNQKVLYHVVKNGLPDAVSALVNDYGVVVGDYTYENKTFLEVATKIDIIKILILKNAVITKKFLNRLTEAHADFWLWMIEHEGLYYDYAAYYIAKNANFNVFVKYILKYRHDCILTNAINYYDPETLDTCLHIAFKFDFTKGSLGVENLIPFITNINHVNAKHKTLLHIICNKKSINELIIIYLLDRTIDCSIVDLHNKKAIDYIVNKDLKIKIAVWISNVENGTFLIQKKINCPGCGIPSDKANITFLPKDIECTVCLSEKSKMVTILPCSHTYCCVECYRTIKPVGGSAP